MKQPKSTNWDFTLSLPLGVVDNQLLKVEEQLRDLNMKALDFGEQCEDRPLRLLVAARLDKISGLVDSIAALVARIDEDIQPRTASPEPTSPFRKPHPDRDD